MLCVDDAVLLLAEKWNDCVCHWYVYWMTWKLNVYFFLLKCLIQWSCMYYSVPYCCDLLCVTILAMCLLCVLWYYYNEMLLLCVLFNCVCMCVFKLCYLSFHCWHYYLWCCVFIVCDCVVLLCDIIYCCYVIVIVLLTLLYCIIIIHILLLYSLLLLIMTIVIVLLLLYWCYCIM